MNHFYTFLASLLFPVAVVIGQGVGGLLGEILYFIYEKVMFLNMPEFILITGPLVIQCIFAGWLAAWVVSKVYGNYHPLSIMILPAIMTIVVIIGGLSSLTPDNFLSIKGIGYSIGNGLSFFTYYYFLRKKYPSAPLKKNK